ncbi:translation initiation factor 1 [Nematocida minor]|uniref:translation initiation factor 1 n=1 Tax=Nematocida minor TaxID=1912983 RepID=UPI002220B9EB|nr:translation initiation factor 1 [Nematocida minor]KAI5190940.1 translation initiation factor 1 [Nematocida minor]
MEHTDEELLFSDDGDKFADNEIHVRKQNRKGRKWLTTVENIPESFDVTRLLNTLKKELCCNGTIVTESSSGKKVLQMQGDHGVKIQSKLQELFPSYKVHFFGN